MVPIIIMIMAAVVFGMLQSLGESLSVTPAIYATNGSPVNARLSLVTHVRIPVRILLKILARTPARTRAAPGIATITGLIGKNRSVAGIFARTMANAGNGARST